MAQEQIRKDQGQHQWPINHPGGIFKRHFVLRKLSAARQGVRDGC